MSDTALVLEGRDGPWTAAGRQSDSGAHCPPGVATASLRRALILVSLYVIPAVMVLRPVTDNDIWMNLRAGSWIVAHRAVPQTDPFSRFGQGKSWVAYSWLFEVLVQGLDARLGLKGIVLYRVVLSYAILLAIHRLIVKREPRFVPSTALAGLAFFAMVPLLNERTWLFTMLFSTLTLDALLDWRAGWKDGAAWWLPPLFALWANLHIQFIYGLMLLALGCAAPLFDAALGLRADHSEDAGAAGSRAWWRLVALSAACFAATLVNPYHGHIYGVVTGYATSSDTYNLVIELLASGFRMPWEWAMPLLVGLAAYRLGRRSRRSTFDALLLSAATLLALRARRDVWLAVLAALAVLATAHEGDRVEREPLELDRASLRWVVAVVLALLLAIGASRDLSKDALEREVAREYPARAAAVVEQRGYPGPLFNEYGWGSYLIWRLPELPVSIDGRADLHGPARIRRNVETIGGLRGWDADPDLMAARTVIVGASAALTSLLRIDPRFRLVHEDPVAAVFLRRGQEK